MKKLLLAMLMAVLLVSCISTNIKYYSDVVDAGNRVFIRLEDTFTTFSNMYVNGSVQVKATSEIVKLATIKNDAEIRAGLEKKGYVVVNNIDDADIIMVGESSTNDDYSVVTLGFYDSKNNDLLFMCEGQYGVGLFSLQHDLDKAVKKALESVPEV